MTTAGLLRLDFDKRMQFPLLFMFNDLMIFYRCLLSPLESYITCNFAKQIHMHKHWINCP